MNDNMLYLEIMMKKHRKTRPLMCMLLTLGMIFCIGMPSTASAQENEIQEKKFVTKTFYPANLKRALVNEGDLLPRVFLDNDVSGFEPHPTTPCTDDDNNGICDSAEGGGGGPTDPDPPGGGGGGGN